MKTRQSLKQGYQQRGGDDEKDPDIPKVDNVNVKEPRNPNGIDDKSIKLKVRAMISRRITELNELLMNIRRNNLSIEEQQLFLQYNKKTDFPSLQWFEPTSNSTTDLEQTCRVCVHSMTTLEKRVSLFPEAAGNNLHTDFEELNSMNLKIYRDDGLPQNICAPCATRLEQLKDFRLRAVRAQYILQVYFKRIVKRNDLDDTLDDPNHHIENVGIEFVKEEPQIEIFDSSELDPPLENFRINTFSFQCYKDTDSNGKTIDVSERNIVNSDDLEFKYNDCETTFQPPEPSISVPIEIVEEKQNDDGSCSNEINSIQSSKSKKKRFKQAEITNDPMSNYKFSRYCGICRTTFLSFAKRNVHMLVHNKGKPQCKKCDCNFEIKSDLTVHYKEVHPSPFVCPECNRVVKNRGILQYHLKLHNPDQQYKCHYCNRTYVRKHDLKNHENTHTGAKPFKCATCGRAFQYGSSLSMHRIICDPSNKRYKSHVCPQCGKSFRSKYRLAGHILIHTSERPFVCDVCDKRFIDKYPMKVHIMTRHGRDDKATISVKPVKPRVNPVKPRVKPIQSSVKPFSYTCKICNQRFRYQPTLTNHMKIHMGEKKRKYICDICNQSFTQFNTLRNHLNAVHLRLINYKCDKCEATYYERGNLNKHILRVHSDAPREYKCLYCSKKLSNSFALHEHVRIHTGEKPYQCETCGARFRHYSTMINHYDDRQMCGVKEKKPFDSSVAQ